MIVTTRFCLGIDSSLLAADTRTLMPRKGGTIAGHLQENHAEGMRPNPEGVLVVRVTLIRDEVQNAMLFDDLSPQTRSV